MTKIISLNITNFRPYYKKNELVFSSDDSKNFNVFRAINGSGKTSLLDAISWCLYGKELHKTTPDKKRKTSIFNEKFEDEISEGKLGKVSVEILMGDSKDNINYQFVRVQTFRKNNGTMEPLSKETDFTAKSKDLRGNFVEAQNPIGIVNTIFPENIQHLFMFDGEKLEKFFDLNNNQKTREAIKNITQIEYISKVIDHLNITKRDYKISDKNIQEEIEKNEDLKNSFESENKEFEKGNSKLEEDIDELKTEKKDIEAKLTKANNDLVNEWINSKNKIEKELGEINNKKLRAYKEKFDHILENIPNIYCREYLITASQIIDEKYESGELPPDIKEEFLNKILEKDVCICGTPIHEGSPAREILLKYKEKAPLSKYESEIRKENIDIKKAIDNINSFVTTRNSYELNIDYINNHSFSLNEQKKELEGKLKDINEEELKSLASKITFIDSQIEKKNQEYGRNQTEINRNNLQIKKIELSNDKLIKSADKNQIENNKRQICEDSLYFLKDLEEKLLLGLKDDIEKLTEELFLKCVYEPRAKKIKITDEYECQVLDKKGDDIYSSLSSGQRQGLATSFMIALRKKSGFDSPILMDYPFGRMDNNGRKYFIDALKDELHDVQVNFFLIDEIEYSSLVGEAMKDSVDNSYFIYKTSDICSEVVKE